MSIQKKLLNHTIKNVWFLVCGFQSVCVNGFFGVFFVFYCVLWHFFKYTYVFVCVCDLIYFPLCLCLCVCMCVFGYLYLRLRTSVLYGLIIYI